MNRVFLQTGGDTSAEALHEALREGHSVASNGPLLALQVDGKNPGDTIELAAGRKLKFRAAMRSLAPLDHVEVLYNGRVVARHGKKGCDQCRPERRDSRDDKRLDPACARGTTSPMR